VVDLGPIEQPVQFAWSAAAALRASFERAAAELEGQIGTRRGSADHALHDWHGRYASDFEHGHMSCTVRDGRAIAADLRRCAQMLHQLAELARQEEVRRAAARAWKVKHDAWARAQNHQGILGGLHDLVLGDDEPKPPSIPEFKEPSMVAASPPTSERPGHG
jgi:hypothetical protein